MADPRVRTHAGQDGHGISQRRFSQTLSCCISPHWRRNETDRGLDASVSSMGLSCDAGCVGLPCCSTQETRREAKDLRDERGVDVEVKDTDERGGMRVKGRGGRGREGRKRK